MTEMEHDCKDEMANADAIITDGATPDASDVSVAEADPARSKKRMRVVAIIGAVVVVLAAVAAFCVYRGVLAPGSAAAKYNAFSYIAEDDVTDYINTYREQMGFGEDEIDDTTWATFLSQYNLTPEILRTATVTQLIYDQLVYDECDELDITVSDNEIDAVVDSTKETYAFGDDDTWAETLELYGQTEEGYRETVELELLRNKLYSSEVETPTPTDEEVVSYITSAVPTLSSNKTKHTYYFELSTSDDETSYENLERVQEVKNLFLESDQSEESFIYLVELYCDDDDLVECGGANGWDIDSSSYTTDYLEMVQRTSKGSVSEIFSTETGHGFIWVDDVYTFPTDSDELAALTEDDMPDSLWSYLSDCAAYELWEADCETYLHELYEASNPIIFDMPSDVPYNVDMSLAQTEDEDEESEDEEDATDKDSE